MRALSVAFFALASLVQAQAQEAPRGPAETSKGSESGLRNVCAYTITGYSQEVPAGVNLCWRVAYPFSADYGLLRCDPKNNFQELATVKRGDRRCDRYEDRQ
jgi:hypothetical protein